MMIHTLCVMAMAAAAAAEPPVVRVTSDNTVIDKSCRVEIPAGTVIADADHNGVIQIKADGVRVEFAADQPLRGAAEGTPWDTLTGFGIRVDGAKDVTLVNPQVHGFKVGIYATDANGLTIDHADVSDNYRYHLRSTPAGEDGSDWLSAHHNDNHEWISHYGGAIYIQDSNNVTIHDVYCRRCQNGILFDRVNDSKVYDNDCSFLTGWGLGLWRSNRNTISRNAFDFCIRGYFHNNYNRGQDSAGILFFEQCNDNVIAENSVTHGGDGFFGFAGLEAIGQNWLDKERARLRKQTGKQNVDDLIKVPDDVAKRLAPLGCNRNLFISNDFSYAAAHGIEMTFSENNIMARNRLVDNCICGIWGGYDQDTLIAENQIDDNGGMGYGLERGGINIEHGSGNLILNNNFKDNICAVHFWWDPDAGLTTLPGIMGNYRGVSENVIAGNTFIIDKDNPFRNGRMRNAKLIVLQLRDAGQGHVHDNLYVNNDVKITAPNAVEFQIDKGIELKTTGQVPSYTIPEYTAYGKTHPVGARPVLRGRANIIMSDWGPWDHKAPMVRLTSSSSTGRTFEVFGVQGKVEAKAVRGGDNLSVQVDQSKTGKDSDPALVTIAGEQAGVLPYSVEITGKGLDHTVEGTLVSTSWQARFWTWKVDPLKDLAGWRAEANGPDVLKATCKALNFNYGFGGPRDQHISEAISHSTIGPDHFGMIATTQIPLKKGRWRIQTRSDDGVRVFVDGKKMIEHWDIHGPSPDTAEFTLDSDKTVDIKVEHFENDGYASLVFDIQAAD